MFAVLVLCSLFITVNVGAAPEPPTMVQVIVQGTTLEDAAGAVRAVGGTVTTKISIIRSVIALVPEDSPSQLASETGVLRVTQDRPVKSSGNAVDVEFSRAVGAQEVWGAGVTGQDITVAFLDSGIDTRFQELFQDTNGNDKRILAHYDATTDTLYKKNRLPRSPQDPNGHGTHIAGIVGNSKYEKADKEYRGLAPESKLVAVRVLDETGVGTYADVLKGIETTILRPFRPVALPWTHLSSPMSSRRGLTLPR
jgi:subtilisin family serine protease